MSVDAAQFCLCKNPTQIFCCRAPAERRFVKSVKHNKLDFCNFRVKNEHRPQIISLVFKHIKKVLKHN